MMIEGVSSLVDIFLFEFFEMFWIAEKDWIVGFLFIKWLMYRMNQVEEFLRKEAKFNENLAGQFSSKFGDKGLQKEQHI